MSYESSSLPGNVIFYIIHFAYFVMLSLIICLSVGLSHPVTTTDTPPDSSGGKLIAFIITPGIFIGFISFGAGSVLLDGYRRVCQCYRFPALQDMSFLQATLAALFLLAVIPLAVVLAVVIVNGANGASAFFAGSLAFVVGVSMYVIMFLVALDDKETTTKAVTYGSVESRAETFVSGQPLSAVIVTMASSYVSGSVLMTLFTVLSIAFL